MGTRIGQTGVDAGRARREPESDSELARFWDVSISLDADERRDGEWVQYLLDDLPVSPTQRSSELDRRLEAARWPRYRQGWTSYVDNFAPRSRATVVIDNNDVAHPLVLDT